MNRRAIEADTILPSESSPSSAATLLARSKMLLLPRAVPACVSPLPCAHAEKGLARAASAAMLGILSFYRREITGNMPPNCRFVPSCSAYMVEAITTYGAWRGFVLSAWRVIRCNPTGGFGYDPVTWPPVGYRAGG